MSLHIFQFFSVLRFIFVISCLFFLLTKTVIVFCHAGEIVDTVFDVAAQQRAEFLLVKKLFCKINFSGVCDSDESNLKFQKV